MGNTGFTSHGEGVRREPSSTRGRRKNSSLATSATTHPTHKHGHTRKHHSGMLARTVSCLLPARSATSQLQYHFSASTSLPVDIEHQLNTSLPSHNALLQRQDSATSQDSLAEGIKATEELSDMTLDSVSSCPLVGPRNITTQFEQTSEMPQSNSLIFVNEGNDGEDAMMQRQSSSVAEMMRQESFEGRMTHSIAIVEEWLASQENAPKVA